MIDFAAKTVASMIVSTRDSRRFGPRYLGPGIEIIIAPVAEKYFNSCAAELAAPADPYIIAHFDAMLALDVAAPGNRPTHCMDVLRDIVVIACFMMRNIGARIPADGPNFAQKLIDELHAIARGSDEVAALRESLTGCPPDHIHGVIEPSDKVFSITIE
jgi:hypothetical protein